MADEQTPDMPGPDDVSPGADDGEGVAGAGEQTEQPVRPRRARKRARTSRRVSTRRDDGEIRAGGHRIENGRWVVDRGKDDQS